MDYDHWIQDGAVLARILQACMYNSVPMDMVQGPVAEVESREDKVEVFLKYARRFGVPEEYLFDPENDLFQMKDIPKVTRCLAMLGKMANMKEFSEVTIELPTQEEDMNSLGEDVEKDMESE